MGNLIKKNNLISFSWDFHGICFMCFLNDNSMTYLLKPLAPRHPHSGRGGLRETQQLGASKKRVALWPDAGSS
jgi:hypothetical protein